MSSPPSSPNQAQSSTLSSPGRLRGLFERIYHSPTQPSSSTSQPQTELPASPASPSDLWSGPARAREHRTSTRSPRRNDQGSEGPNFPTSTLRVDGEPVLLRSKSSSGSVPTPATASASASASSSADPTPYRLNSPRFTQAQSHALSRASSTAGSVDSPRGSKLSAYSGASAASAVGALAALSGKVGLTSKGKGRARENGNEHGKGGGYEALEGVNGLSGVDDGEVSALDGDEGVLVDDEACFVDGAEGRVDFLSSLPSEISLYILLHLDFRSLLSARQVSRHWSLLSRDNLLWRDLFHREPRWRISEQLAPRLPPLTPALRPSDQHGYAKPAAVAESPTAKLSRKVTGLVAELGGLNLGSGSGAGPRANGVGTPEQWSTPPSTPGQARGSGFFGPGAVARSPAGSRRQSTSALSSVDPLPSPSLGSAPSAPLGLDWPRLYKDRWILEQRWAKGQPKSSFLKGHEDSVYCVQFDDMKIVSGSRDKTVRVWNAATGYCARVLEGHGGSVLCLAYDERELFTGSSDACVFVWDLVGEGRTGKGKWQIKRKLVGHSQGVLDLTFNDNYVVSCSKDTTIRVWSRTDGALVRVLAGHRGPVNAIQLHNSTLVSASGDSLIKLWNIDTGEVVRVLSGHTRGLACVQISPSGNLLASGSNDQTIKLWNPNTGECIRTFEGHTDLVRSLAFDEGRRRLVSGSYDKTARLWDLDTGAPLLRFRAHGSLVFDVKFDVSKIISSSHDGKVVVLDFGHGLDTRHFL